MYVIVYIYIMGVPTFAGTTKQTHWRNLSVEDCETPPTSGQSLIANHVI